MEINIGKAMSIIDIAIAQLAKLREEFEHIIWRDRIELYPTEIP